MIPSFKAIKIINTVALLFLLLGGYGLGMVGVLQFVAAILFLLKFPKNKLIYIYFGLVILFFLLWDGKTMDWLFAVPIFLVIFLTYIIFTQKPEV